MREEDTVYKEDVKEIIFRIRSEISNLSEKQQKYIEKTDEAINAKMMDIKILEKVAETLPEKQPPLFDKDYTFEVNGMEMDPEKLHQVVESETA